MMDMPFVLIKNGCIICGKPLETVKGFFYYEKAEKHWYGIFCKEHKEAIILDGSKFSPHKCNEPTCLGTIKVDAKERRI